MLEAHEGRYYLWFYVDRDSVTHFCALDWNEKIPARPDRAVCGARNTTRARYDSYTVNGIEKVRQHLYYYFKPEARGLLGWCPECLKVIGTEDVQRLYSLRAFELGAAPPDWSLLPCDSWVNPGDARRRAFVMAAREWANTNGRLLKRPVSIEDGMKAGLPYNYPRYLHENKWMIVDKMLPRGMDEPECRDHLAEQIALGLADRSINCMGDDYYRLANYRKREWEAYRSEALPKLETPNEEKRWALRQMREHLAGKGVAG